MEEETTLIMASLSSLSPSHLSDLTLSIHSDTLHHLRRVSLILSSPPLFFLTLHRLHSLPLSAKTLLIARHLLSSLHLLTRHFPPKRAHCCTRTEFFITEYDAIKCEKLECCEKVCQFPYTYTPMNHRDLDTVLLLLLLCELRQHNPEALEDPPSKWLALLRDHCSDTMLRASGIGVYNGSVLIPYIEMVTRCWRLVSVMGGNGKAGKEVAASPAAVVALPSVEVRGGASECVICRERMREGRDVCMLPCEHLFHWMCILPWLRKKNTCPCCRFQLPTDDVFGEIQRLWDVLIKKGRRNLDEM